MRVRGDQIREEFLLSPVDRPSGLVVIAPARRAGDPGLNPGPDENFPLKLLMYIHIKILENKSKILIWISNVKFKSKGQPRKLFNVVMKGIK